MTKIPYSPDDYIYITNGAKYWVGRVGDIISLTANENYTEVALLTGSLSIRMPLYKCEMRLPHQFFRISRSCIVNLACVKRMAMFDHKRFFFVMDNDSEAVMSREQTVVFRKSRSI